MSGPKSCSAEMSEPKSRIKDETKQPMLETTGKMGDGRTGHVRDTGIIYFVARKEERRLSGVR